MISEENQDDIDLELDEEEDTSTDEEQEDTTDWKARAQELEQKASKQRENTKALKAEIAKLKESYQPVEPSKSNEPDYAKLAFLKGEGITHPDDQKLVQDEAARLKMPLTDILAMGHIKSQLETARDQREAQAGMPKGPGRGSGKTQQDVDYWLAKPQKADGTYETPSDIGLAEKVINARMNQEKSSNKFSDELY